jgi:uncharacterized repeat protein (TIGR01451 family)
VAKPFTVLLENNLRTWFGARGFWLVIAAAFVPLILTGAWVATHQRDVVVVGIDADRDVIVEGDRVNLTATVRNVGRGDATNFNVTIHVLRFNEITRTLTDSRAEGGAVNTTLIASLNPGQTGSARLTWDPRPGLYWVIAVADPDDQVPERDEFNIREFRDVTDRPDLFIVAPRVPAATAAPNPPPGLTGNANATAVADVAVEALVRPSEQVRANDAVTFTATFVNRGTTTARNVTLALTLGNVMSNEFFSLGTETRLANQTLEPGQTRTVTVNWTAFTGTYWARATADVGQNQRDPTADNHRAEPFVVVPRVPDLIVDEVQRVFGPYLDPPPQATIKAFYLDLLSFLHLRFLLPLIGLFYAAGVLADDRERGNLVYVLTRPINRWLLPVTKFSSSFVIASVAVLLGIVATFFLLLGTPEGNLGYLTTPLLISLATLFAYGSLFTLLGVVAHRPYLWGLGFIAWEFVVLIGSTDLVVNGRPVVAPWVQNLTLIKWLGEAIANWPLAQGLVWLPEGAGMEALRNVLLAAAAFLVAAVVIVHRREYDV